MDKIKFYADKGPFILEGIKNGSISKDIAINFLQEELHEILYSYVNGGFSKKGFIFYPLIKDLSEANTKKIWNLKTVAGFLHQNSCDFTNSLELYGKKKPDRNNAQFFVSSLYRDFSKIKKTWVKSRKIKCQKFDFSQYSKSDMEYLQPVAELKKFAAEELKGLLVDFHIHGSIATKDYIKGWSDLDTFIIIKKEAIDNPESLVKLRNLLYNSKIYFYRIDPLQHHGHMATTEYDMDYYCQAFFPTVLFKYSKSIFGNKSLNLRIRQCKAENISRFCFFVDYFKSLHLSGKYSMGSYELKNFLHAVTLFPTMYLQAKNIHVYKKFSFAKARKDFNKNGWEPIDAVTAIRERWKTPNNFPFVDAGANINPLLAYQINSRYWDLFNGIGRLNNIDAKSLVEKMDLLARNAAARINFQ